MPILRENSLEIQSRSAEQTLRLGQRLGELLTAGDIICLHGGLGAGKTTFARGVGQGWGSRTILNSPTYTIVNIHQRQQDKQLLYHVDAYRLENTMALESIGFDDIFDGNGPILIEWPQRLKSILPNDYLWLDFNNEDDDASRRVITIENHGERHLNLLNTFRQAVFGV